MHGRGSLSKSEGVAWGVVPEGGGIALGGVDPVGLPGSSSPLALEGVNCT